MCFMKNIFSTILLFSLFVTVQINAQSVIDSVKWVSIEKAGDNFLTEQRPIMLFFYDSSCDSCEYMHKSTFSNPEVSNYINILFYPVKIDINTTDTLRFFDGSLYANSGKNGGVHNIANVLGVSKDSLPALVVFSRKAKGRVFSGYKNRDEIFRILVYYNESIDDYAEYDEWYPNHIKAFPPGKSQVMTRLLVKWKTLPEALEEQKIQKRKIILNLYNYNRVSCTIMRTVSFNHQTLADNLNKYYYPVNIDVYTQDTLEIFGQKYINENQSYKYHQLPIAALEGKMVFPVFIILDEDLKVIGKLTGYFTPEKLEPILNYYSSNSYKTMTYDVYVKNFVSAIKKE